MQRPLGVFEHFQSEKTSSHDVDYGLYHYLGNS
jgi:hypothetical protein